MNIKDADFQRLAAFVRGTFGINLEHKRQLVEARLSFDLARRGFRDFTRYVDEVTANPNGAECRHMMNRLSTNYTFFFREPDYIGQLRETVLPDLVPRGGKHIKIWSAACSSGQETYSAAMALELQRRLGGETFDYSLVGTDINTDMLAAAEEGIYSAEELERIPRQYRQFVSLRADGSAEISRVLKDKIAWRYENLLDPAAGRGGYDIVFCRNVMIYFTPELRREMTVKLYSALLPGGYLFTGTTESIDLERRYFKYIAPAFYKRAEVRD